MSHRPDHASSAGSIQWPGGAKCAAAITFDVDSESLLVALDPENARRRVGTLSWSGYDRVAIPRILDGYRELGVRGTFMIPAWSLERHWDVFERIAAEGHEIGLHGYVHELTHELPSREVEAELLERSLAVYERLVGGRPAGWRGPFLSFSEHSAELLTAAGFSYDSTLMGADAPYVLRTAAGTLIELPIDTANDDWPQYASCFDLNYLMPIRAPERAHEVFRSELLAMREVGGLWIATWHPFVSGRPARFKAVRDLIEWIRSLGDVWLTSLEEISAHVARSIDDGSFDPRIDELPYLEGPDEAALAAREGSPLPPTHRVPLWRGTPGGAAGAAPQPAKGETDG